MQVQLQNLLKRDVRPDIRIDRQRGLFVRRRRRRAVETLVQMEVHHFALEGGAELCFRILGLRKFLQKRQSRGPARQLGDLFFFVVLEKGGCRGGCRGWSANVAIGTDKGALFADVATRTPRGCALLACS